MIRGVVLLPFLVANVVVALLWFWMLDSSSASSTRCSGLARDRPASPSSATPRWAIPTIALVNIWRHMGYTALLIFAGLQTIPTSVYEAAAIDGAERVADVLADHPAAAAAGAGAGAGASP